MDPSSLRVAFISDALLGRNGVGTYYEDLVENLRDHLARADLFCPTVPRSAPYQGLSLRLPGDSTQRLCFPHVRRLGKTLGRIAPHIVVAATPGPYGVAGARLARKLGTRLCVGYHTDYGQLADLYWNRAVAWVFKRCLRWTNSRLFRAGGLVVVNSVAMRGLAQQIGAPGVRVVGTPIAKRLLSTPVRPPSQPLRTVLYAGRLAPEKNLEAVVEAAETLTHLRFVIAGDGPQRPLVEEAARRCRNLDYAGWVPREEMVSVFDAADMLVLPSSVESFGTVALEAMARQRPVLVSPHCGILDWQRLAGGVFRMREEESLGGAIERIAQLDPQERQSKAETARMAAQALNAETRDGWLDAFEDLASRAPARARAPRFFRIWPALVRYVFGR